MMEIRNVARMISPLEQDQEMMTTDLYDEAICVHQMPTSITPVFDRVETMRYRVTLDIYSSTK
jgi:hypothetical protein